MKAFRIIIVVITLLLLFSVTVCGLSISANGTDAAGLAFHKTIGISAAIFGAISSLMLIIRKKETN